ncbi:MAG: chromosome segregation protein SMC [Rhodospirillaceae bacterium]|nr:chromosome segregation protein SMC [Rhodospirillaceae bacterium]
MQFSRLRLSGFKSFVDATELDISNGLTGVVGPNGCGKSNLVEGLRWVMGETSAKRMRGGEMDDVIFNGTSSRPARNLAEVALLIDNSDLKAPNSFNDSSELNVIRRIERSKGSNYRVNGRDIRSRDVQLLFADAGTGARSAGIVSQGRIGALINAKPSERRILLEEAANIRGLYTRRHEAELRLKAAETNLERLEDILTSIQSQLKGLKQQAKQAVRYRAVNEQIRQAESVLLFSRWQSILLEKEIATDNHRESNNKVRTATEFAARASTKRADAVEKLPGLRAEDVEAAAALQTITLGINELDGEQGRIDTARTEAATRLMQISDDITREGSLEKESSEAVKKLKIEYANIENDLTNEEGCKKEAASLLTKINREADLLELKVAEITEKIALNEASRSSFGRQLKLATEREERLMMQIADSKTQRIVLEENSGNAEQVEGLNSVVQESNDAANKANKKLGFIENEKTICADLVDKAYTSVQDISAGLARLEAESGSLSAMLSGDLDNIITPIVDEIEVEDGYETALSAALGDDLTAPIKKDDIISEKRVWTKNGSKHPGSSLPDGVEVLANKVSVPQELQERVKQVGVASDMEAAIRLQTELKHGQCLTTLQGGLWRWDGYVANVDTVTSAEIRIQHRNRIKEISLNVETLSEEKKTLTAALTELRERLEGLVEQEKSERLRYKDAYEKLDQARQRLTDASARISEWKNSANRLDEIIHQLTSDKSEALDQKQLAEKELGALEDIQSLRAVNSENREKLSEQRSDLVDARAAYGEIVRLSKERTSRLESIRSEDKTWIERSQRARIRIVELESRKQFEKSEIERLEKRPEEIMAQRKELMDKGQIAEVARKSSADKLAVAEIAVNEADTVSRQADQDLSKRREERVRTEAALEQINHSIELTKERIKERLECSPENILERANIQSSEKLPDLEATESRLERLTRERERIGPVNLRAEIEVTELETQLSTMEKERDDLTGAIDRLRRAIASLNKEGRDRLLEAFDAVNKHFQDLFIRLFGGGTAHLTLVEADDPLDAGVEIMTSPPGKKLQSMSLLSGGEQALTALALVFAAFLTNPSPICVLDEVDAPLDDSNVDRFCSLLSDISKTTKTRFLIITHHRLTMARMDRLYGVTMAEQGVSQLVSVNLEGAEELREAV